MPVFMRMQMRLDGWSGAPGVNTLCFYDPLFDEIEWPEDNGNVVSGLIKDMYTDLKPFLVAGVTVSSPEQGTLHRTDSGDLVSVTPLTNQWQIVGEAVSASSRAVMLKAQFHTDAVRSNRLLRGGIYIGPIGAQALESTGLVRADVRNSVASSFGGMIDHLGGEKLCVYSSPKGPTQTYPDRDEEGMVGTVKSVTCMPVPAILRSRRD